MGEAILFAVVASSALPLGALIAIWAPPPRAATAALLGDGGSAGRRDRRRLRPPRGGTARTRSLSRRPDGERSRSGSRNIVGGKSRMAEILKITPTESVEVVASSREAFEVEATYGPASSPPPRHFHPSQDEHFEVLAGTMRVRVGGEERELAAGEEIDVGRGRVHQMWNPGTERARVRWVTAPALRTERWFRAIDALHREGRVGRNGMPGPLAFGVLLTEYRDVFRLAGPDWLLRPALGMLAVLGRARGYRP